MQDSNAIVKKIYCIVINGEVQKSLSFKNIELEFRKENLITIREIYRITTDIIIREVYQNVD